MKRIVLQNDIVRAMCSLDHYSFAGALYFFRVATKMNADILFDMFRENKTNGKA